MKTFAFLRESPLHERYRQSNHPLISCGKYNGYVGIMDDSLPLSEISDVSCNDYYSLLDSMVDVHGGLTFDGNFDEDEPIIPLTEIPAEWWMYRIVGFDCAHLGDTDEKWTFERTKKETLRFRTQIEKI